MPAFPLYLVVLIVLVNRYLFGILLRRVMASRVDAVRTGWEPTVTVVTPMFNEGRGIARTIETVMALDYPRDRLEMVIVDDCSTDDSYEVARRVALRYSNVRVVRNPVNGGKRRSINEAVRHSQAEITLSVDSDVEVDPGALRNLLARFTHAEIAAVGGRVHVSNAHENWLTRMQAVKYWFGYEFLKNLERSLQSVMCLSGCLTAYRRSVLVELEPILESRNILGVPIKYGEDRFLTRQIVKRGYRTVTTLDAVCYTVAPNTLSKLFSQQLRWRRSNLVDVLCGVSHAWRLHPFVCVHYLSMASLLFAYPLIVLHGLVTGSFYRLAEFHLWALACGALGYWAGTRELPARCRVHPACFLAMAVIMPVTYLLLTPLAMFTLDSSSWETRGKPTSKADATRPQREPERLAA